MVAFPIKQITLAISRDRGDAAESWIGTEIGKMKTAQRPQHPRKMLRTNRLCNCGILI